MSFVLPFAALGLGLVAGLVFWYGRAKRNLAHAKAQAERLRAEAAASSQAVVAEAEARVERDRTKLIAADEAELAEERRELEEYEKQLVEREQIMAAREQGAVELEKQAEADATAVAALEKETAEAQSHAADVLQQRLSALEDKAGQTRDEVRELIVREQVSKTELASLMRLRESEEKLNEAAPALSRSLMQVAIERYDGAGHLERVQNTISPEEPGAYDLLAKIVGHCRALLLEETGCELVCDDLTRSVTVRGDDPLARELARRMLRHLTTLTVSTPNLERLRTAVRQAKAEIDREVQNAGRRACRVLNVGRVHPDILNLVGRLKFRLSYSQNQWKHSIEVGYLAGILAEELGVDPGAARRGGLLHDIGKAMTHDHDGSHAVLGAEVARRCGEEETIANAIGAHHNDEPPRSIFAHIVTAADALSGGRPGARRESVTQYLSRIQDIQRIASRSPAVRRVDIMHAGREVRVVVAGDERGDISAEELHRGPMLTDADITPLAQEIARGIERELTFAGQIKVTVIRESRAVSVAR